MTKKNSCGLCSFKNMVCYPRNTVDYLDSLAKALTAQINQIQKKCRHRWQLAQHFHIQESKVKNFFLAGSVSEIVTARVHTFSVRCLKCSLKKDVLASDFCPFCVKPSIELGDTMDFDTFYPVSCKTYSPNFVIRPGACKICKKNFVWPEKIPPLPTFAAV